MTEWLYFLCLFLWFYITCGDGGQVCPAGRPPVPRPAQLCPSTHLIPRLWILPQLARSQLSGPGGGPQSQPHRCFLLKMFRCLVLPPRLRFLLSPAPPSTLNSSEALVLNPSLFQMWQHLTKAEAKLLPLDSGGRRELSESVYTDVLDQSCSQTWQG